MNTRLQVEHPVTEEVTGVDLVREQLLEAAGERLEVSTVDHPNGHAIEVRLNSEDPAHDYLPATGTMIAWRPASEIGVRFESGVEEAFVVGTSFDPLIAKVIAHAPTRAEAAAALALALERTTIQGVQTNRDVLVAILGSPEFLSGATTTDFLERVSLPARRELSEDERASVLAAVVLSASAQSRSEARVLTTHPAGWRNSDMPPQQRILSIGDEEVTVSYQRTRAGALEVEDKTAHLGEGTIELDGRAVPVQLNPSGASWWVHGPWGDVEVVEKSPFPSSEIEEVSGSLVAPMPGKVVSIDVAVGDTVTKGQTLLVLEAMKMEHTVGSPEDGTVSEIKVSAGEQVERGALLVVVEDVTDRT
jgi:acetyl/propionyl-CoA carboxylase alpha subunit